MASGDGERCGAGSIPGHVSRETRAALGTQTLAGYEAHVHGGVFVGTVAGQRQPDPFQADASARSVPDWFGPMPLNGELDGRPHEEPLKMIMLIRLSGLGQGGAILHNTDMKYRQRSRNRGTTLLGKHPTERGHRRDQPAPRNLGLSSRPAGRHGRTRARGHLRPGR